VNFFHNQPTKLSWKSLKNADHGLNADQVYEKGFVETSCAYFSNLHAKMNTTDVQCPVAKKRG
jgi:hypothetical protein